MSRLQGSRVETLHLPERLKQETADIHKALEDRLDLLRDGFTSTEYAQLLARFYGFYQPWERAALPLLRQWDATLFEHRSKCAALEADLRYLGIAPASLPLCAALPPLEELPWAIGSAYVLEGATLGGQFLRMHFEKRLGIPREAMGFYAVYGANTGAMWKSFREGLIRAESLASPETFVAAARSTFEALAVWLTREARSSEQVSIAPARSSSRSRDM